MLIKTNQCDLFEDLVCQCAEEPNKLNSFVKWLHLSQCWAFFWNLNQMNRSRSYGERRVRIPRRINLNSTFWNFELREILLQGRKPTSFSTEVFYPASVWSRRWLMRSGQQLPRCLRLNIDVSHGWPFIGILGLIGSGAKQQIVWFCK